MTLLLELKNVCRSFGGIAVADDVSLSLAPGARTALIGPNGAGKTTLVNLITGYLKPSSGSVLLSGRDVTNDSAVSRVRAGLVRSFQVTRLFPEMSVEDHLGLAILQREGRTGRYFGHYRKTPKIVEEADALLKLLDLTPIARRQVSEIAYGQQRLLELALALALKPKVLLLDEPAAGVPQSETGLIEEAIRTLPDDLAVLMIDHDMDLVFRFAREVIVLAAGRVIFDGEPEAVSGNEAVREAYLGNSGHARSVA